MKRQCIHWLCLAVVLASPTAEAADYPGIFSGASRTTSSRADREVAFLKKQLSELQQDRDQLKAQYEKERAAWKRLNNPPVRTTPAIGSLIGYRTIKVPQKKIRRENRQQRYWCAACNDYLNRTVTVDVPYTIMVEKSFPIYQHDATEDKPAGVYKHNGRAYFWNGVKTFYLDDANQVEFFREAPQGGEWREKIEVDRKKDGGYEVERRVRYKPQSSFRGRYSSRYYAQPVTYNYRNTGRFVRDDGAPNGPVVATAKAAAIIPLLILRCLLR